MVAAALKSWLGTTSGSYGFGSYLFFLLRVLYLNLNLFTNDLIICQYFILSSSSVWRHSWFHVRGWWYIIVAQYIVLRIRSWEVHIIPSSLLSTIITSIKTKINIYRVSPHIGILCTSLAGLIWHESKRGPLMSRTRRVTGLKPDPKDQEDCYKTQAPWSHDHQHHTVTIVSSTLQYPGSDHCTGNGTGAGPGQLGHRWSQPGPGLRKVAGYLHARSQMPPLATTYT